MNKKLKRRLRGFRFSLRKTLFALYALLKYRMRVWKYLNRKAISEFEGNKPQLNNIQKRILSELNNTGIAVTHLDELFGDISPLQELLAYVEKRKERTRTNRKKPFLEDMLPEIPELGFEVPFFKLAINTTILDVVNSYMGMHSMLYHFMVRKTKLAEGELPSHSQNWHRAPQEKKNCRVYLYLTDVDEQSGPFMYIPESTVNKKHWGVARQTTLSGGYNTAEELASIPDSEKMTVCGKAGTVIFCDSTGLHRGGYSKEKTRIMSTFGYGAPTLRENIHYSYPTSLVEELQSQPQSVQSVLNPRWARSS